MGRGTPALATPSAILAVLAALYAVTAYASWTYPPDYLHLPRVWAVLATVASVCCAWCIVQPGRKRVAVAGAACIGAAFARAAAISVQLIFDAPNGPLNWSFALAAVTWGAVAVLVNSLWHHAVLPWAATVRTPR
jgi:hypothetical protein